MELPSAHSLRYSETEVGHLLQPLLEENKWLKGHAAKRPPPSPL
jgi:hypothetical protein